ncbi:MAG: hypothetical protein H7Y38_03110 [Armatimonadetes bacterium]|nr:hypothetical protein [Armatimonadota bacterium]
MANETPGIACPNCGPTADTAQRLCPNCGTPLPGMQTQAVAPPPVLPPGQPQQPWAMTPDLPQGVRQKGQGNKIVSWVLGGCALLALLVLLGLLALCGIITI